MSSSSTVVLPPVERTPLLVLRFSTKASHRLQQLVEQRLHQEGLVTLHQTIVQSRTVVILTAQQQTLEEEAEMIHMVKRTVGVNNNIMDHFTIKERHRFCDKSIPYRDSYGLFTASDWSLLAYRILDGITVLPPQKETTTTTATSELSDILDQEYRAQTRVHVQVDESSQRFLTRSSREKLREHGEQSACLRHVLQTYGLIDALTVVHLPQIRNRIVERTWWQRPWNYHHHDLKPPPIDEIQSYYGWEIGFYFAWMGMLSTWLAVPGVFGLLFYFWRLYRNDKLDEDEFLPFFGILMFLWAILFLRFWDRQEHRLAFQWGTYSLSPYQRQKFFAVRPEFRGYLRISPVTGLTETYYPAFRRRLKYVVSAFLTMTLLLLAFVVTILSLNLQGYIQPKSNPSRWDDKHPHPFYIRPLAVLSEQGQVFDMNSSWRCYIPVVLHIICIFTFNKVYGIVAEKLTSWENHETQLNFRNSLVLKRFLFEAFDCYMSLFYLAFYERDVDRLRMELVAVFQIDTIRRLLLECIVPMVSQRWILRRQQRHKEVPSSTVNSVIPTLDQILDDLDKDSYEQFDDYMEIVIELGYVTLFASAYPLASLVSIAANWVEIRSDCYKVAHLCQRPIPYRTSGLGMWRDLMACVIWMSALTNCLIAGFTSDQLMHYLPSFYIQDEETGYTDMGHEKSWIVVFVIFGLERLLILIGLLIHAIVPAVPEDVSDQLERQHYARLLEAETKLAKNNKKTD